MSSFERLEKSIEGTFERFLNTILGPDGAPDWTEFVDRIVSDLAARSRSLSENRVFGGRHVVIRVSARRGPMWDPWVQTPEERVRLVSDIRKGLEERGIRSTRPLRIDLAFISPSPPHSGQDDLQLEYEIYERLPEPPRLILRTNEYGGQEFTFRERLIAIGRGVQVEDAAGRVVRRNTISLPNPTISRSHARIEFDDEAASYRLFDETADSRTILHRQTGSFSVRCGAWLREGDEIHLGPMRFMVTVESEKT